MSTITPRSVFCTLVLAVAPMGAEPSHLSAQDAPPSPRRAIEAPTPLGLTVEEALGETLLFDYSNPESGLQYRMHVTLRAHEVSWTELRDGGRSETDSAQSVRLDDHRLMMTWLEESGQFVVLYVDLLAGQTTYCGLLRPGVDDRGVCYTGTVQAVGQDP